MKIRNIKLVITSMYFSGLPELGMYPDSDGHWSYKLVIPEHLDIDSNVFVERFARAWLQPDRDPTRVRLYDQSLLDIIRRVSLMTETGSKRGMTSCFTNAIILMVDKRIVGTIVFEK